MLGDRIPHKLVRESSAIRPELPRTSISHVAPCVMTPPVGVCSGLPLEVSKISELCLSLDRAFSQVNWCRRGE